MFEVRSSLVRLAPLTGLVFAGLLLAAVVVGGSTPNSNASAASVVTFYEDHQTAQNASNYLFAFGALFALFFAAVLSSHLRARSSTTGPSDLGFAGAIVLAGGITVAAGTSFALTDVPTVISPTAEQALNVISNDLFLGVLVGAAAFLAGYGIAIAWTGALPRWLGWVALVLAIVCVIPPALPVAGLGLLVWVVVVTAMMLRREWRSSAAPTAAAQAP